MRIKIDGEMYTVKEVYNHATLPLVEMETGEEFYLAESSEEAGKAARKYWEDLAQDDPREFACIVGEESLVAWGLGEYGGPGLMKVTSLEDWLDLWLDTPEEHFASYDSLEREVERCGKLAEELDFVPKVAYRHN